jgi:hypothetical protein
MIQKIQLLNDTKIRIGQVTLSPWPCYESKGEYEDLPQLLTDLLLSKETIAQLWAAKLSRELRQQLLSFPKPLLPDLLSLSQLWPERFIDWSQWCPALITLLTQIKAEDGTTWDRVDQLHIMQNGWREVLKKAKWPVTRSNLKLLRKIPIEDCSPKNLLELREHLEDRRKRKLLRHTRQFSSQTLDTLRLPAYMLSVRLLEVSENEMLQLDADSVCDICRDIIHYRREMELYPLWPYSSGRFSARTLMNAAQFQMMLSSLQRHGGANVFPSPPMPSFQSKRLSVEPVTSISAIYREGNQMQNCVISYGTNVLGGTHYIYRMHQPERATVLLVRNQDSWFPSQVKTFKNGDPKPETLETIEKWLGTKLDKEAQNDFPF